MSDYQLHAGMERRLKQLEDWRDIIELKHRYLRSADRHDVPSVKDCFAPDNAVIEFEGFPRCESRGAFAEMMNSFGGKEGFFTMHHGHNLGLDFTGNDSAKGIWTLHFSSIDKNTGSTTEIGGEYHEEYARINDRWYIQTSIFHRQYFRGETVGEDGIVKATALGDES